MQPITVLSIAGSDSGGGAGIQADIRSFSAFGVHATTALTAITAQNTLGVSRVQTLDPGLVEAQVRSVTSDFEVAATKTGMLAQASTVERVAQLAREGLLPHLVVDPVLVSTSGHVLMADGGVEAYRHALFPMAEVVTPNLREAAVLCGVDVGDVSDLDDVATLARTLLGLGPRYVLVKGGHVANASDGERAPDLLVSLDGLVVFDGPRVDTRNDHGTGCSLSSAIAAGLGLGRDVPDATRDAKSFVLAALTSASSWRLGEGRGPIDHLGWGE
ncbi:MAG TPA: bifunctional hydroxymethylpyrimidine kinase/phosphomethylpyrimidine kinase [Acidimicrobiales bacterium]|nr:bifunctional hydroxymethylpyrimidine kinase/phosphomethylpyrimidine kinase [Acidimicrobiales bacterium]